jgi:hypothetical protein
MAHQIPATGPGYVVAIDGELVDGELVEQDHPQGGELHLGLDGSVLYCRKPYPPKVLNAVRAERDRLQRGFGARRSAPAGWQWTTKTTWTNGRTVICGLEPMPSPAVGDRVRLRSGASGVVESVVDTKVTVQCDHIGTCITNVAAIAVNHGPAPEPA